ncbi:hypothetical protein LO762_03860 [Actinocorallia sp. API 0066]|uniref:hypothetical protein n=1 Tax=Actinocorallia sp. API 0066 TaxID=2896846 RepID=UPI001E3F4928|nr:hypothetical protein [Actinocorallia sp. API 0066]MCD0448335.1 hypothetical protein [Actinocorallia sp. API 0066]
MDRRKTRKVALQHLSWAEVAHEARLLCHHEGVANPVHAWLLGELLHYLEQDNAGCGGFQNMGGSWVPVRNAIAEGTLPSAARARVLTRITWLLRQLTDAPGELRVEALAEGRTSGPCELLKNLRAEPGLLVPSGEGEVVSFRLSLPTSLGTKRGTGEAGFIRGIDAAVNRFHAEVLTSLKLATSPTSP